MRRRDVFLALALMALAFLTRWPLRGGILEEYDSANYAFALDRIDAEQHWPHPPGYILFVWASRLAHVLVAEPVRSLATVNAISGVVATGLLFVLFRLALSRSEALWASIATLTAAQVWFQQTRPLEDAFAFACLLAAALPLALALLGRRGAVLPAFFLAGLVPGAKQLLALFLFPLACRTLWVWWGRDRALALRAAAASALGASIWLVPLCYYTGSFLNYLTWGWGQVLWLDQEALVTNAPLLSERLHSVFVVPWAIPSFAWLWLASAWGAVVVWHERPSWRFMFWLLAPILALRLFALGQWPRFSIYYLPFLLAFVVVAATDVARRLSPMTRHLGEGSRRAIGFTLVAAGLALWTVEQARFILPTLRSLRDGPSPVAEAIRVARSHVGPRSTLVIVPSNNRVVLRQAEYYGSRAGFDVVEENKLEGPEMRTRKHLLYLFGNGRARVDSRWVGALTPLAAFTLPQPRWKDLSLWEEAWDVGLAEQAGSFVRFVGWTEVDGGVLVAGRGASRIDVLRPPERGLVLRLELEGSTPDSGRYRVNRQPWRRVFARNGELALRVAASEIVNNRVWLSIRPFCPKPTDGGCLRVADWTLDEGAMEP